MPLDGKHILLGITGGIAAYKTPALVRQLTSQGAVVQVVMTQGAAKFVTATTLQAVSGRPVRDDLWDSAAEASMGHIELARWADCIVVAPATAHVLARLSHGLADDLLTAMCLAATCPIAVAPAMNHMMWKHPATQRNLDAVGRGRRSDSRPRRRPASVWGVWTGTYARAGNPVRRTRPPVRRETARRQTGSGDRGTHTRAD